MSLDEFVQSSYSNEWLQLDHMLVYVRKGHHAFGGEVVDTFDIANVNVEEEYQNRGVFTQFLNDVESLGIPVHIENVLTERFANFFRKRGYTTVNELDVMTSFLKK